EYFDKAQPVTVNVKNKDVKEVLPLVLGNQPFDYRISGNIVTLIPKAPKLDKAEIIQHQQVVSGSITDSLGTPLEGVSVLVKGSSKGGASDSQGKYQVQADKGDVLLFRLVGYSAQTITIGDESTINITLMPESSDLDEVVV